LNRREEEQYPIQQRIDQGQTKPSPLVQIIAAFAFIGFIIAIPTIVDKLGK